MSLTGRIKSAFTRFNHNRRVAHTLIRLKRENRSFVYLDVGSAGGIPSAYRNASQQGLAVLLLADPQEDWRVNMPSYEYVGCDVRHIPFALGRTNERRTLHITAAPGCSSCLFPNEEVLSRFPVREWFRVVRTEHIQLRSFLDVQGEMNFPDPDIIKMDVQGLELEVLNGLGILLNKAICVELEVNLEQMYVGQPVLGDIYSFMHMHGFALRDLQPQGPFEGEAMEFNSFWSRKTLTPVQVPIEKFWRAVHNVWDGEYFADSKDAAPRGVRFNT